MTRRRRVLGWALAAATLGGCAPRVPPSPPRLESPAVAERFAARLAERGTRAAVAEGDYSVWVRRAGARDLPGVSVRVWLAAPDAFRLRVDAPFGTAVDAAGLGDTLVLDAPALGLAAVTGLAEARSSRGSFGSWVWCALGAGWTPPAAAWETAAAEDSAVRVSWSEAGDARELVVAPGGLPRRARLRPAGDSIELRYERWASWDGVMWPARLVVTDGAGRLRVTLQPQSLKLRRRDASPWRPLRVPRGAVSLSRSRLLSWLEQLVFGAGADSSPARGE